jgi:hypothetical protein
MRENVLRAMFVFLIIGCAHSQDVPGKSDSKVLFFQSLSVGEFISQFWRFFGSSGECSGYRDL